MGRPKKSAPKLAEIEPEEISQEEPEEEPETDEEEDDEPEPAPAPTMTKADVCRALLAEGITENEDAVAAAKSRFGIEIKPTDFSLYKSKEKAKQGSEPKGKPGRKPKADSSQAVEGYLAPPPKSAPAGGSDLLVAMEAMKPLVASLGKEQVKRIVDLLG